jgi:hypothetical protein
MINNLRDDVVKPIYHKLYKYNRLKVVEWSPYENVYFCCTQKTASQWFRNILRDPEVYKYTGLRPVPYVQKGLKEAHFDRPFPDKTICIHLYIDYPTYLTIPKPSSYKTFFVLRDPRDIIVSWYFSTKYSHPRMLYIAKLRDEMENMSFVEGMNFCIDTLEDFGLFYAQRSWMNKEEHYDIVKVFRYEDFASDNYTFLHNLFEFLDINMPKEKVDLLYEENTFSRITGGRELGEEDEKSHYRKGVSGDWEIYFEPPIMDYFRQVTGDLLEVLGYE